MKAKTVVIAGLVASTTTLPAQDIATPSPNDAGVRNLVTQVTNPSFLWTNKVSFHSIDKAPFVIGTSNMETLNRAEEFDFPTEVTGYQVISLFPDQEETSSTGDVKVADSPEHTAVADTSLFDDFPGNGILYWIRASVITNGSARTKNGAQIIAVESGRETTAPIRIPEHGYFVPPPIAWYEWINPRVFIPRWTGLWMTESEATPVVLVMAAF